MMNGLLVHSLPMNKMFEALPDYVTVGNVNYKINTDFRVWLEISEVLSSEISIKEKLGILLVKAYEDNLPNNLGKAVAALIDFLNMGKSVSSNKSSGIIIDFNEDRFLINAAFRQQYGINLFADKLHWWEFLTLLQALGEETAFMKIVAYRSVDISSIKDENRRKFYRKMKNKYMIKNAMTDYDIADIIDTV